MQNTAEIATKGGGDKVYLMNLMVMEHLTCTIYVCTLEWRTAR